jgi:hypothetical protein
VAPLSLGFNRRVASENMKKRVTYTAVGVSPETFLLLLLQNWHSAFAEFQTFRRTDLISRCFPVIA